MKKVLGILLIIAVLLTSAAAQNTKKGGIMLELGATGMFTSQTIPNTDASKMLMINTSGAGIHFGLGIRGNSKTMFMLDSSLSFTLQHERATTTGQERFTVLDPHNYLQFNLTPTLAFVVLDASSFKFALGPALSYTLVSVGGGASARTNMFFGIGFNIFGQLYFTKNVYFAFGLRAIYDPVELDSNNDVSFSLHASVIPKVGFGFKF